MAGENVSDPDFRSYEGVIRPILDERPKWDLGRAQVWLFDAIGAGKVRLESNPDKPPRFTPDSMLEQGTWSALSPERPYWRERYSWADIKRELGIEAQIIPLASHQPEETNKRHAGRKPTYPWERFAVCFGALLLDERAGNGQEDMIASIQKIASQLGEPIPDRTLTQEHRDQWTAAFAKWKKEYDAGN